MILDRRYRIIRPLGAGGFGAAYLVEDQRLERQCVVKASTRHSTIHYQQFEREAKMLAGLYHPHLPQVYDYFFEQGVPYLVMQYIQGATLDRLRRGRRTPFGVDRVLNWADDLLDALVYLHSQAPPIIHRDIKPPNICITPEEKAVLLDFGIARQLDHTCTSTGARASSQCYSPIEQYSVEVAGSYSTLKRYLEELEAKGIRTGPYSDIYSLGATLYFALTLHHPPDACLRQLGETPRPLQEINPDVPDAVVDALDCALTVDPRERCQSAVELKHLLQPQATGPASPPSQRRRLRPLPRRNVVALEHVLVYIAGGEFLMGSDEPELPEASRPPHQVDVGPFCLAKYPVTNADYQCFLDDNPDHPVPFGFEEPVQYYNWDRRQRTFPPERRDHPVVLVSWHDALAYCRWLSDVSGYRCRLPTEAEWEKAAAWDAATGRTRRYPWGDEFDEARCNTTCLHTAPAGTTPVTQFAGEGRSTRSVWEVLSVRVAESNANAYGLSDCAGNVWEWTSSLYQPYPYRAGDGRENPEVDGLRVVRGGAYDRGPEAALCAWREGVDPNLSVTSIGFRVACAAQ